MIGLFARALLLVTLATGCDAGPPHLATAAPPLAEAPASQRHEAILFLGTITTGVGVDLAEAYPVLMQQRVDARYLPYVVVNAGLRGETTAGGRLRVREVLGQQPVRVFVLGLGGNDGLRGLPLPATRRNLQAIIDTVRRHAPHASILLAGVPIPARRGLRYSAGFQQVYAETARRNYLVFISFLSPPSRRTSPTPVSAETADQTLWHTIAPLL